MRNSLLLLLFAAFFACKAHKDAPPKNDNLIRLATQGCRGYCPVYTLDFRHSGGVSYEGIRFVEKTGKDEFKLTREELNKLKAAVLKTNLWQYPENIESRVADAPYATLTVFDGGKTHPVSGSIDRPLPIMELEMLMKDLAEAHKIKVKKGFNPDDPMLKLTARVVVKLKPDVSAGKWVGQFNDEVKLRLVRRVSTENNWMIAYNPQQFSEKEIMDLLKTIDGVLDAIPAKEPTIGH
jgi:Domain of unknown function (DUF6438)